ncbi:hypothetical protein PHISP_06213 [Aspergillus sp. HF37]|nr:hypothetical protein PHISP_06213 [Aspergillus sp. HF37]
MSTRAIFLMGAPTPDTVDWDKDELLDAPVFPFYANDASYQVNWSFSENRTVKWRSLQDQDPDQPVRDTQTERYRDTLFVTEDRAAVDKSAGPVESQELSLFHDDSFSIHEVSEVSASGTLSGESHGDSELHADSTELSIETSSGRDVPGRLLPTTQGGLSDLKDIPNAGYLQSIAPQTMTVNLIAGVITIYPPRRVVTRQWKHEQEIVEMVVADETKTGFNVTFWLPSTSDAGGFGRDDDLRGCLAGLRPRDIVLLRTVALSSFRERVYGQSLRKGMTKVDLLHRQPADATDTGGLYSLRRIHAAQEDDQPLMKVRRVREWIKRFVEDGREMQYPLPPDTQ